VKLLAVLILILLDNRMIKIRKFIEWNETMSVGIQEIDEQHKLLVDLINQLHEAVVKSTDEVILNDILTELAQYTIVHFTVEESLMRIFDYPRYEEHKKQHESLKDQVFELQVKIKTGESSIGMEILGFLRNWLTHHILKDDKLYTPFFLEKGIGKKWAKRSWVGKIWDSMRVK